MTLRDTSIILVVLFFALRHGALSSRNLSISEKDPACYLAPKWDICKYHYIQWQREYRWRAYYDPRTNDCYYYRGCPETNTGLFTYDVDCRRACVTRASALKDTPDTCFQKPELGKCEKKVKKFWFDAADLKCKTFFSCENSDRGYWKSKTACQTACFPQVKKGNKGVANTGSRLEVINREVPNLGSGNK